FTQLIDRRNILGKSVREVLPELKAQGFFDLLDQVYASGQPFFGHESPLVLQPRPDVAPSRRFINFIYQPVLGFDGKVSGIFIEGY
ncbi:hybrid sensor histidine kinase/response regulator, partial [Escherichia coli]|uniref:PAS domain-containing protein n=1 Tax=Escherichia coli TaxID=562 RepID=UPI000CB99FD7